MMHPTIVTLQVYRACAGFQTIRNHASRTSRSLFKQQNARLVFRRHASRVTVKKLSEIPQGMIDDDNESGNLSVPASNISLYQQVRNNMDRFENCVLLTKVGNFYEMYFEHAEEIGVLLGLKIAYKRTSTGKISMSGFPYFQLDKYLKSLVQEHGKNVAIAEECSVSPSGGPPFDRQVKRVITPGTLIDEQFLTPLDDNFLLVIHAEAEMNGHSTEFSSLAIAWIDLASGAFYAQTTELDLLGSEVARLRPREVVIHESSPLWSAPDILRHLDEDRRAITKFRAQDEPVTTHTWMSMFEDVPKQFSVAHFEASEVAAINLALQYVSEQLRGTPVRVQSPIRRVGNEFMQIDRNSLRGLEITQTLRDGYFKGSLLHAVRQTVTESGARLLSQRLTSPSTSLDVINHRLDLVSGIRDSTEFQERLMLLLKRTSDTPRLVQRFALGRGNASDLVGIAQTVKASREIADILKDHMLSIPALHVLSSRFSFRRTVHLADAILRAIDEEGLSLQHYEQELEEASIANIARGVIEEGGNGTELSALHKRLSASKLSKMAQISQGRQIPEEIWMMRRSASKALDSLHVQLDDLKRKQHDLEASLKTRSGADSLSLKWTPGLGHIVHTKGKDAKAHLADIGVVRLVSSSKSTKSFHLSSWTELGNAIENQKARIRAEENLLFQQLREGVVENLVHLRQNAAVLDDIDVACSSASLARKYSLVRPQLNTSCTHTIHGGRHLTVEANLAASGRSFVSNDCILTESEPIWFITGPNMAGKSTFLRQVALISILAQAGLFVPANHASMGLVDAVFSRIGSADNVSQDQSTFMVEMMETSYILRHATKRSLVIMDEVGRGTTPEDGTAVGYGVLEHLSRINQCRVLFATHFHKLANLTRSWERIGRWCTGVREDQVGGFWYDRKLRPGVNWTSHALKAAKLAGMPQNVIDTAQKVLDGRL